MVLLVSSRREVTVIYRWRPCALADSPSIMLHSAWLMAVSVAILYPFSHRMSKPDILVHALTNLVGREDAE